MKDKGFEIPSERAQKGQLCAGKLLEWIRSNEDKAGTFALKLLESLKDVVSILELSSFAR